jgi:arsenate reductase-like glutaredoxin family protein
LEVQIFGVRNHADVRKALRFFAERRVKTHFVDFKIRGPAPGELKRFVDRLGVNSLVDRNSKRFVELGLGPSRYGDAKWLELLLSEPMLLKLPLVRSGTQFTAGPADGTWVQWIESAR